MKIDKSRFRYLTGVVLLIPILGTLIFFLGGLVVAVILQTLGVINHGQAVLACLSFAAGGLIVGIIATAQKVQRALRVFRDYDHEIERKKYERPVA